MATNSNTGTQGVQTAGDVQIRECTLITASGAEYNLQQFIGEINVYEDMFKTGMYGNILLIDAANISQILPITGNEYLRLDIQSPSMDSKIYRTFKVYSMTNKMVIRDTNTQSFVLHFTSPEVFIDLMSPIYSTFRGKVSETVAKIWTDTLATSRNGVEGQDTPLVIVGEIDNQITFTSPGWSPMHCINWLAARSVPSGLKNPGFLFYESNKAYYFANVEAIIDEAIKSKQYFSDYIYVANNLTTDPNTAKYAKDINKEYQKVMDFEVVETYNAFKNVQNGYYANRLITLDVLTKKYEIFDYDHVSTYDEYQHLENITGNRDVAPFNSNALRNPAGYIKFYPKHENLFNNTPDNANDVIEKVLPRRLSTIQELGNFKIIITVPGRTDAEVGSVIYFNFPDTGTKSEQDKSKSKGDAFYSGYYLITAIRHKITLLKHMMIMEIVKDSYHKEPV